jgi:hypothetical protein
MEDDADQVNPNNHVSYSLICRSNSSSIRSLGINTCISHPLPSQSTESMLQPNCRARSTGSVFCVNRYFRYSHALWRSAEEFTCQPLRIDTLFGPCTAPQSLCQQLHCVIVRGQARHVFGRNVCRLSVPAREVTVVDHTRHLQHPFLCAFTPPNAASDGPLFVHAILPSRLCAGHIQSTPHPTHRAP